MGHDAKVCLKHYAQTTEEHFDRPTGGAEYGALGAQNQAQKERAGNCGEMKQSSENQEGEAFIATPRGFADFWIKTDGLKFFADRCRFFNL
jgi:hypothetical protein